MAWHSLVTKSAVLDAPGDVREEYTQVFHEVHAWNLKGGPLSEMTAGAVKLSEEAMDDLLVALIATASDSSWD